MIRLKCWRADSQSCLESAFWPASQITWSELLVRVAMSGAPCPQAEKAINLDANNEAAWSYKTNLLTEAARLAEMDNKLDQKAQFSKQADEARKRAGVLSEERRKKEQEAANAATPPTG